MTRAAALLAAPLLPLAGCDDMTHQPKQNAYADARVGPARCRTASSSIRTKPLVPPPVTLALLQRGQERFRIYCTPCHSELGDGHGMIVQRGFPPPPSYHIDRLREAPVQHFYDVITNGYGAMYSFAYRVQPARPLGDRRLYTGAAAQPECDRRRPDARAEGRPAVTATGSPRLDLAAACGLALAALGWVLEPRVFFGAWLAAITPAGRLAARQPRAAADHALTGGRWGEAIRPQLLLGVGTLPLLLPRWCRCWRACRSCIHGRGRTPIWTTPST